MILVGDVGGTRTRFALATKASGAWQLSNVEDGPTTPDVASAIARYVGTKAREGVTAAAFGAAGAVSPDGSIRLTNVDIRLEPGALARAAGLARVVLVNDFGAIAEAVPHLPRESLVHCGGGQVVKGQPVAVLGPGTGLGTALGAWGPGGWIAISGEGGHSDLAPVDDEELETWQRLRRAHGRVSAENDTLRAGARTLVCGGFRWKVASRRQRSTRPPGAGSRMRGRRTLSSRAGLAASQAILPSSPARGAAFISRAESCRAGVHASMSAAFRRAFEDKAPYTEWLRAIPTFIVTYPQPGLLGLAVLADASS